MDDQNNIVSNNKKDETEAERLKNQIWITRVSRVNAEKRLLSKNSFIQGVNIYYSCVTIIFSILSLVNNNGKYGLVATFMSLAVLVAILYLKSLRFTDIALKYRHNYTKLHKLEFQLSNKEITTKQIIEIQNNYCNLLNSACNHIPYDYYRTIAESKKTFRDIHGWKEIKHKYYWECFWRIAVKTIIIVIPVVLCILLRIIQ